MNRDQNRKRNTYSENRNNSSLGNNRSYQGTYRTGNYTINPDSYDDGYDDNYPSPTNYMNAGNINMGKRNRYEDNMFRPDMDESDDYYDEYDDLYDETEDDNDGLYGYNSGRNDYSYLNSRNHENRYGHYGRDEDDNYSQSAVYAGRTTRGKYSNESANRRGKTQYQSEPEQMNSRSYNNMYDNRKARNNGDYRYNNVGGGHNSRYNTFNDDRDYYHGYSEFADNNRDADRWRGRSFSE